MKQKILVVDDEEDLRDILREQLTDFGFEVEVAQNSTELIGKIETFKPDLIILDILLGEVNAADFISRFTFPHENYAPPILFLSGLLGDKNPSPASTGRKCALRGKPFQMDQILKDIQCLLEKSDDKAA